MSSDRMVRGLKEFFEEYNGCRNCRHQPEPMQMCEVEYGVKCKKFMAKDSEVVAEATVEDCKEGGAN